MNDNLKSLLVIAIMILLASLATLYGKRRKQ
jgi:LPXTG-motif cell wall-anchored protein